MCVLLNKVPIRKKSGNLLNDPRIYIVMRTHRWSRRSCLRNDNDKKKDARFTSSVINNKRTQGMGTPSQDISESGGKQQINSLAKLQYKTPVVNSKYKHIFIKIWKWGR